MWWIWNVWILILNVKGKLLNTKSPPTTSQLRNRNFINKGLNFWKSPLQFVTIGLNVRILCSKGICFCIYDTGVSTNHNYKSQCHKVVSCEIGTPIQLLSLCFVWCETRVRVGCFSAKWPFLIAYKSLSWLVGTHYRRKQDLPSFQKKTRK